jgi:uncharacterized protein (DUF779 family)
VHKDAFGLLVGRLDEVKYLVGHAVFFVEKHLVLLVDPVVREVDNADVFPQIGDLAAGAVDDVRDFVSKNEFQILKETSINELFAVCRRAKSRQ